MYLSSGRIISLLPPSIKMWNTLPKVLVFLCVCTPFYLNSVFAATPDKLSYAYHCASFVPESTPKSYASFDSSILSHTGYYAGGGSGRGIYSPKVSYEPYDEPSNAVLFNVWSVKGTDEQELFKVDGSLQFPRDADHMGSRLPISLIKFSLGGFWSEASGQLCMVGTGSIYSKEGDLLSNIPALLKLHNLKKLSSITSLVSGTLESLMSSQNDPTYFDPLSILLFPRVNYQYNLVSDKSEDDRSSGGSEAPAGSLENFCSVISGVEPEFNLQYPSHCLSGKNCTSPLSGSDLFPSIVALRGIECLEDKRRLRVLIEFSDWRKRWYRRTFNPKRSLVGEGSWDENKNQLHVVACHFLNAMSSFNSCYVGDCSTRLSLSLTTMDVRYAAGNIWSNKAVNKSGYFDKITFGSHKGDDGSLQLAVQIHEHTQIEKVTKFCPRENTTLVNNIKAYSYPNPFINDMRFHIFARRSKSEVERGRSFPLSVGSRLILYGIFVVDAHSIVYNPSIRYNIRYSIYINLSNLSVADEITAQGVYDGTDGSLCMVGCRDILSQIDRLPTNESKDCEILLKFQLPPLNSERKISDNDVKGSIESTREKSDPLHFERLDLSSADAYMAEAVQSFQRVRVEGTLVLISFSLAYVFGAFQLFYVKKNPDVLPSISISMLLILTLGYLKPLMHYSEVICTYSTTGSHHVDIASDGWLQIDQATVRAIVVMTLLTFLLQFCLLQQTWSARFANGNFKELWDVEKKALSVYAIGVFAVMMASNRREHSMFGLSSYGVYAGLVLDGFLFLQILLNMICKSKEKSLSVWFYIGTTFVRVLPHAYDLYRTGSCDLVLEEPYVFASPETGFYSTDWDVIISTGALLFSVIIFLQHKFGGRCFLPQKWRELGGYEMVPKRY